MSTETTFQCECCQEESEKSQAYANSLLLGTDAVICRFCFRSWYDTAWATSEDIATSSRQLRAQEEGKG